MAVIASHQLRRGGSTAVRAVPPSIARSGTFLLVGPSKDELLVEAVGEELVVYDPERHRAHYLNRTAALVWQDCDGRTNVAEVATLLARELGLPADEKVVRQALEQLEKARLVREPLPRRSEGAKLSRRDVVRKLGLVGALSCLMPVVSSIIAPTPAIAGYPPPPPPPEPHCRLVETPFGPTCVGGCPDGANCEIRLFKGNAECVCVAG